MVRCSPVPSTTARPVAGRGGSSAGVVVVAAGGAWVSVTVIAAVSPPAGRRRGVATGNSPGLLPNPSGQYPTSTWRHEPGLPGGFVVTADPGHVHGHRQKPLRTSWSSAMAP